MHGAKQDFLLLDRASLVAIDVPAEASGASVQVVAAGVEDAIDGVKIARLVSGEALRPPAPVHAKVERKPGGDFDFNWVRRSRAGWTWLDGSDVPLGEEAERYLVILSGSGFRRQAEVGTSSFVYSVVDQVADGAAGPVSCEVVQIGTAARSRPAKLSFFI